MNNEQSKEDDLSSFQVPTIEVEKKAGILLWSNLVGESVERKKNRLKRMWKH